jgi:hypothetical protein
MVVRCDRTFFGPPRIQPELSLVPVLLQGVGVLAIAAVFGISRRIRAAPVFFAQDLPHRQGFLLFGGNPS